MALSQTVQENLKDAEAHLRSALASAARNERPAVSLVIAEVLAKVETIGNMESIMDKLEDATGGNPFGFPGLK